MKKTIIASIFAIAALLTVSAASANAASGGVRPGWGFGDENHVHVGPPGTSVVVPPGL
jgi:hypothetical protein